MNGSSNGVNRFSKRSAELRTRPKLPNGIKMLNIFISIDMAVIYLGLENLKCVDSKMEETDPIPVYGTEFEVQRLREERK